MNPEQLAEAKRHHDIEMTVSAIAYLMATSPNWDADFVQELDKLISEVAPPPGDIQPGNIEPDDDTDDPQPGGYEQYVNALMTAQLPVSWGMIAEAQALDAEANDEQDNQP